MTERNPNITRRQDQPQNCTEVKISRKILSEDAVAVDGIGLNFHGLGYYPTFDDSAKVMALLQTILENRDTNTGLVSGEIIAGHTQFFITQTAKENIESIIATLKMDI